MQPAQTVRAEGRALDQKICAKSDDLNTVSFYDLFPLRKRFDLLDPRPSDTVLVSAALVGLDRSGKMTALAREVLFQGAKVFAPLEEPK